MEAIEYFNQIAFDLTLEEVEDLVDMLIQYYNLDVSDKQDLDWFTDED